MSVLETIRKRAGIFIVIAIGASMVIFILEDALTSGRFFFGGNENTVATVNGKKLDYQALNNKIEEAVNLEKVSKGTDALDNQAYNQTVQSEYQQMLAQMILDPQCKKLGVNVTDSELADLLVGSHPAPEVVQYFTNPQTGRIYDQLMDPKTGGLNMAIVVQYVKQMNDQNQNSAQELASWTLLEKQVKARQYQTKYFSLLTKGLFITDAEAKQAFEDQNKFYSISYILKKYSDVPDKDVTVTDQDIDSYYNQHLYDYNQTEETRKVDYVTFFATPTSKDLTDIQKDVDSVTHAFKNLKAGEDSAFVIAESDEHFYDDHYHKHGQMDQTIDSIMSHCEKGYVYGPYKENGDWRIAKAIDVADLPDSIKLRMIVLPGANGDLSKVKPLADSLKGVLTTGNFEELAKKYSQDESAQKGGDKGWIQQGKVPNDLEQACFFANKGDIKEIKSQGAYLLLWIEDQSPKEKFVKVGVIVKKVGPSTETLNNVYAQASSFSGKHSTTETFEQSADQMNKRVSDLKENDQTVAGLQTPKELIRWAFQGKTGDVSGVFDVGGDRYVVAHIVQIMPMGTTPLDLVRDQVKQKAIEQKKAEKLMADMKSAMQGANNIAAVAQKTGVQPAKAQRLSFQAYNIPGLGKEDALLGVMAGIKPQTVSQPIQGEQGVFVLQVDSVYSNNQGDYRFTQMQQQQALRNRVQYDAFDALQRKAGLVSHLGKFY